MRGVVVGSKAFSNVTRNFSKLNPMNKLKTNSSSSTLKSEGNYFIMIYYLSFHWGQIYIINREIFYTDRSPSDVSVADQGPKASGSAIWLEDSAAARFASLILTIITQYFYHM